MATKRRKARKGSIWRNKYLLYSVLVLIIIIAGAVFALWPKTKDVSPTSTSGASKINYNPPTSQDKQDVQSHKQDLSQSPASAPPITSGKKQITPVIINADQSGVNAQISGIFEDNGTCTARAVFGSSSNTVTKSSAGFGNASYTNCTPISWSLSAGTWTVTVSYSSPTSSGTSSPTTVEVK
jgi:hypothetical protein